MQALIVICQEGGITKEAVISRLMEKCNLTYDAAEEKVNQYWEK